MRQVVLDSLQVKKRGQKTLLIVELLIMGIICFIVILSWLGHLGLSQDSTGYITASENLIRTGRLSLFVNITNWINDPAVIPYMEQPPGFPLLLVPFIFIFRDPLVSALIAQCVYLVLFYLFIYLMSLRLQFSPVLRIVTLILFTFMKPFWVIHNYFWTETLFIALSMGAVYFAVGLLNEPNRKRDWIILIILLSLTSLIRYTGIANLVLLAPFLLKRDSLRAAQRLITNKFVLTGVTVAGGLLIAFSLLANLLPNAKPGIGPMQWLGILLGATGLLIGMAGLVFLRKNLSETPAGQPLSNELDTSSWALFAVLASVAPVLAWIVRNTYLYHTITKANKLFQVIQFNRFAVPFQYIWDELLGFQFVPRPLSALLAAGLLFLPFFRLPVIGMSGFRRKAHIALLSVAAAHFLLIWFLSFVTANENIGARYFSPVLAFLLLGLLNGLQQASHAVRSRIWRQVIYAAPLFFLVISTSFLPGEMLKYSGKINYPPERQLWQKLNQLGWVQSSSFFYSDDGFAAGGYIHQIFSGKPQGILWDPAIWNDPQKITDILSRGNNPFILVTIGSPESNKFDEMISSGVVPLEKISFPDAGFVLYHIQR
jgi:hypothetical protein